jgi:hypothetical protein
MGPAYFVIAIMGCGDGGAACQTVATPAAHYSSEQACLAARTDALMANSDLDFPTLLAECLPVSQKASAAKARETKQPDDAEAA